MRWYTNALDVVPLPEQAGPTGDVSTSKVATPWILPNGTSFIGVRTGRTVVLYCCSQSCLPREIPISAERLVVDSVRF